jgi:hypothetical protein
MNHPQHKSGFTHHNAWAQHIKKMHQTRPETQILTPVSARNEAKPRFFRQQKWGNPHSDIR